MAKGRQLFLANVNGLQAQSRHVRRETTKRSTKRSRDTVLVVAVGSVRNVGCWSRVKAMES